VTKSGTNGLHGDLFYYLRYPSRHGLDPVNKAAGIFTQGIHQQQQFGGSVGGPVITDKLSYFLNYDGSRKVFPVSYISTNISSVNTTAFNYVNAGTGACTTTIADGANGCVVPSPTFMAPFAASGCARVLLVPHDQPTDRSTSDRDLGEFLQRACHDLKGSLRAIRTQAELLRRDDKGPGDSDFEQRLSFIVDGARKIDSLTDGLSGYSIALQVQEDSFQPTRMDVLLRTVLARLDKELRNQEAEVTSGELPRVSGNPDRLLQVLENLLRNALRHRGQASPRIRVTAVKQAAADGGDEWLFAVRDNGPGIEAAYLERIFRPFERLSTAKPEGPGMGLAICRAIVERHGGRLWAESAPGTGSTFLFSIPVTIPATDR
jgi:hypothetical protein